MAWAAGTCPGTQASLHQSQGVGEEREIRGQSRRLGGLLGEGEAGGVSSAGGGIEEQEEMIRFRGGLSWPLGEVRAREPGGAGAAPGLSEVGQDKEVEPLQKTAPFPTFARAGERPLPHRGPQDRWAASEGGGGALGAGARGWGCGEGAGGAGWGRLGVGSVEGGDERGGEGAGKGAGVGKGGRDRPECGGVHHVGRGRRWVRRELAPGPARGAGRGQGGRGLRGAGPGARGQRGGRRTSGGGGGGGGGAGAAESGAPAPPALARTGCRSG
uniref:Glycine-rich protein DOT1-like n=1 Tax=Phascolarctos cinereus TaxID=38626 RepID=A0A6P5JQ87_PHACI|nr:glycine-rich protein DOT1-like [Phascolarctos cinereus]